MAEEIVKKKAPAYVITCGDEGVQVNEGQRISVIGCGLNVDGFSKVVKALKKLFGPNIAIATSQENDWAKDQLKLTDWQDVNASFQQQIEALADKEGLKYSGLLPFTDPRKLKYDIKGHMVRPKGVHVANTICFTLGGGEKIYNLGQYQISGEWLHILPKPISKKIIDTSVKFYGKVAGMKLKMLCEMEGVLGEKIAKKNLKVLQSFGYKPEIIVREEK